jgi:hypothetical protein
MVLATADQLRARLQDPGLDDATALQAITDAGNLVRAVSRQDLDFSRTIVELVGGGRDLVLPQRPVVEDVANPVVVEECWDGQGVIWLTSQPTSYHRGGAVLRRRKLNRWNPKLVGYAWYAPAAYGVWAPLVRVTYSHGYQSISDVPGSLTTLVLSAAVTLVNNPQGLRAEQVGGVTLTWSGESIQAPAGLVDWLTTQLPSIGIKRGRAFSIGGI